MGFDQAVAHRKSETCSSLVLFVRHEGQKQFAVLVLVPLMDAHDLEPLEAKLATTAQAHDESRQARRFSGRGFRADIHGVDQ